MQSRKTQGTWVQSLLYKSIMRKNKHMRERERERERDNRFES